MPTDPLMSIVHGPESLERLQAEGLLVRQVQAGSTRAWEILIAKYEGRLHAFVSKKILDPSTVDDLVQEAFLGFLTSLVHFDVTRSIESYLFSICSYKVSDHFRRLGRRQKTILPIPDAMDFGNPGFQEANLADRQRMASSIYRSQERREKEKQLLAEMIRADIQKWRASGDWTKLKCLEFLFVVGLSNKEIATRLELTEQKVANYKSDYLIRLKKMLATSV